jgi:hypothetical protein
MEAAAVVEDRQAPEEAAGTSDQASVGLALHSGDQPACALVLLTALPASFAAGCRREAGIVHWSRRKAAVAQPAEEACKGAVVRACAAAPACRCGRRSTAAVPATCGPAHVRTDGPGACPRGHSSKHDLLASRGQPLARFLPELAQPCRRRLGGPLRLLLAPRRIKEQKEARKAADKERKEAERERKQQEAQARLAKMTDEERIAHEERRKVGAWARPPVGPRRGLNGFERLACG